MFHFGKQFYRSSFRRFSTFSNTQTINWKGQKRYFVLLGAGFTLSALSAYRLQCKEEEDKGFQFPEPDPRSCALGRCEVLNHKGLKDLLEKSRQAHENRNYLIDTTEETFRSNEIDPKLDYPNPSQLDTTSSKQLKYDFVIVGAGKAGIAALSTLQYYRPESKILIIGGIPRINRICDSKDELNSLISEKASNPSSPTDFILGLMASKLDSSNKKIQMEDGREIFYDKILLATGGEVQNFDCDKKVKDRVKTFKSLSTLEEINQDIKNNKVKRIAIIGGGYLGTELSMALHRLTKERHDTEIYQIFKEPTVLFNFYPDFLSNLIDKKVQKSGIQILPKRQVKEIVPTKDGSSVEIHSVKDEKERDAIDCDIAIYAPTHIPAETSLAKQAGLPVDEKIGGIKVDKFLKVSDDIYVAGDAANFPSLLDHGIDSKHPRNRIQNYDHAINSGRVAAQNMIGARIPYNYNPTVWTNLSEIGLWSESVGIVDSSLETVSIFQLDGSVDKRDKLLHEDRGCVFYLKDRHVVGATFINMNKMIPKARRWIESGKEIKDPHQLGQLIMPVYLKNPTYKHTPEIKDRAENA